MSILAVIGVVLVVVGLLALFNVIALTLPIAITLIVIGLVLALWFGRTYYIRR